MWFKVLPGRGAAKEAQLQLDSGCLRPDCLELGNLHATKARIGWRCLSGSSLAQQASEAPGFIPALGNKTKNHEHLRAGLSIILARGGSAPLPLKMYVPPPFFLTALVFRAQSFPDPNGFLLSADPVWRVLAHLSTMLLLASICWGRTLPCLCTGMLVPGPRGL